LARVVYADLRAHGAQQHLSRNRFGGDRLRTEQSAAFNPRRRRRLLLSAKQRDVATDDATPAAILTLGSATFFHRQFEGFCTARASATIRPNTESPTIGHVTVLSPKELVVKSTRGSLTVPSEDDVRVVAEGTAYRIVLDSPGSELPRRGRAVQAPSIWRPAGQSRESSSFGTPSASPLP